MVVTQPGWNTHRRALRHELRARRDLLVQSLRSAAADLHVSHVPSGGLNLWIRLPDATDVMALVRECEARGFCAEDPARFPEAGRILAAALRHSG